MAQTQVQKVAADEIQLNFRCTRCEASCDRAPMMCFDHRRRFAGQKFGAEIEDELRDAVFRLDHGKSREAG